MMGARLAALIASVSLATAAHGADIAAGKYICFTSHLVGIQAQERGIVTGDFKPADGLDKFFITIRPLSDQDHPLCTNGAGPIPVRTLNDWYLCATKFQVTIEDGVRGLVNLRGDYVGHFIAQVFGDFFDLNLADRGGVTFRTGFVPGSLNGQFLADGKCSAI